MSRCIVCLPSDATGKVAVPHPTTAIGGGGGYVTPWKYDTATTSNCLFRFILSSLHSNVFLLLLQYYCIITVFY